MCFYFLCSCGRWLRPWCVSWIGLVLPCPTPLTPVIAQVLDTSQFLFMRFVVPLMATIHEQSSRTVLPFVSAWLLRGLTTTSRWFLAAFADSLSPAEKQRWSDLLVSQEQLVAEAVAAGNARRLAEQAEAASRSAVPATPAVPTKN